MTVIGINEHIPSVTAVTLIKDAKNIPFMSWRAKAIEYARAHGYNDPPNSKAELLDLLEAQAEREAPVVDDSIVVPDMGVEVILHKKYTPYFILDENTNDWIEQTDDGGVNKHFVPQTVPAGLTFLHGSEIQKVIEKNQAQTTPETFRQLDEYNQRVAKMKKNG